MRVALALACSLLPVTAAAAGPAPVAAAPTSPVIGGKNAKQGAWPDVAGIMYPDPDHSGDESVLCTGTLVAPTVVLTAAHCYDALQPLPEHVLIGTADLARPEDGEIIAIKEAFVFPDPETTLDLAVLVLDQPSTREPRKIADGWARADLVNGAAITFVGFGAIDEDGGMFINELQEASSTITDADCSKSPGCRVEGGELGAGGKGIDTCTGDSGGPLYLKTGAGFVLAGVTSRSYDDAQVACSDGGIYVRPDGVLDWIEMVAGVPIARTPGPTADPIVAIHGNGGDTRISVNDSDSDSHRFAIIRPPAHGQAKIRASDGTARVCTDADAPVSDDQMSVRITDADHSGRALTMTIAIHIVEGTANTKCDFAGFDESGGCCDAGGRPGAALPLALGVLALVRRRRRRLTAAP
jgi:endonuclease G